jgi:acyl-coenzyme A thioesterase PaaI-like protein
LLKAAIDLERGLSAHRADSTKEEVPQTSRSSARWTSASLTGADARAREPSDDGTVLQKRHAEPRTRRGLPRARASFVARQNAMKTIGAELTRVKPGLVEIELPFSEALTRMPASAGVLSIEFKVNLLAAAKGELSLFRGTGTKPGRTIIRVRGLARPKSEVKCAMAYEVDFETVSTVGLESSPVAEALAGLRANEARYFRNKYDAAFVVEPASKAKKLVAYVHRILKEERGIVIASRPLEATELRVDGIRWTYVFYESGLAINVLYTLEDVKKRAVGFKLSDGMDVPEELARFKFARQKSKLAGTIRGSFFVIKGEY